MSHSLAAVLPARRLGGVLAAVAAVAAAAAGTCAAAQTAPSPAVLLNRMNSAYRAITSYRDTATLSRQVGRDKAPVGAVTIAMQRPAKFLLDVKGEKLNTVVVSDGATLLAVRPDRNAYIKSQAPDHVMGADLLAGVDLPTPGARLITVMLESGLRRALDPIVRALDRATVTGPEPFGDKFAYALSFPYDASSEARIYVTSDDFLVRRAVVVRNGRTDLIEEHDSIQVDRPVPDSLFVYKLPDNARVVFTLPALPSPDTESASLAPDFTAYAPDGQPVRLSDFHGKIVVLDFWATWCGPCQVSMPHVQQVYEQAKGQGVVVLGVCVWDDRTAFDQWLPQNQSRYGFNFAFDPAGKDSSRSIAMRGYGVDAIPTTFVIDKDGKIAAKVVGYTQGDTHLEDALRKLGVQLGS